MALGFFFGRQLPNFAKKKTLSLTGWQMRVLFQELPCQVGMDTLHHSSVIGEHLLEPVRFWKRPTISFHFLPAILVGFKKKERKI